MVGGHGGDKECRWRRPDGAWGLNGTKLSELPLYGSERVAAWGDPDDLIVLTEGEKARDALDRFDAFDALGTVCGASATPGPGALEVLKGRRVCLWPDNDRAGRDHMERVAEALRTIAAEVLVYTWDDAPEKGDAADHPAVQSGDPRALDRLLTDLEGAPRWKPKKPAGLQGRILLGEGIAGELEPPDELEPGILLRGKVHSVYAGPGTGKTMLMLWLAKRRIDRGEAVVVLDMENGPRIVSERLRALGADAERTDELLHYFPSPNLSMTAEAKAAYREMLDEVRPALVVFDSWINFLASAGMDENSSNDVAYWAVAYTHPARDRGISVVLLDHVPHEGSHARGSTRKKDEVDVMWRLHNTQPFDRGSVGEIVLHREKDREAWLPSSVKFSVGTGDRGFFFARSAGTVEETADGALTDRQRKAHDALKAFGERGARYAEWRDACGLSDSTYGRAISALTVRGLVRKADGRYFPRPEKSPPPRDLGGGGGGGLTSGSTPTNPQTGGGDVFPIPEAKTENPHEPPNDPQTQNGGGGNHNPHTPKGWGYGGNPGGDPRSGDPSGHPEDDFADLGDLLLADEGDA